MVICNKCKQENGEGHKYCSNCGSELKAKKPTADKRAKISIALFAVLLLTATLTFTYLIQSRQLPDSDSGSSGASTANASIGSSGKWGKYVEDKYNLIVYYPKDWTPKVIKAEAKRVLDFHPYELELYNDGTNKVSAYYSLTTGTGTDIANTAESNYVHRDGGLMTVIKDSSTSTGYLYMNETNNMCTTHYVNILKEDSTCARELHFEYNKEFKSQYEPEIIHMILMFQEKDANINNAADLIEQYTLDGHKWITLTRQQKVTVVSGNIDTLDRNGCSFIESDRDKLINRFIDTIDEFYSSSISESSWVFGRRYPIEGKNPKDFKTLLLMYKTPLVIK